MRIRQVGCWVGALLLFGTAGLAAQAEPGFSGFHLHVEQDEFAKLWGVGGDQNYTMGVGIQVTGRGTRHLGFLHHGLDRLFQSIFPVRLAPDANGFDESFHSAMLLGSAFTPDDLLATEPVIGERPYGSLLGLVTGRTWVPGEPGPNGEEPQDDYAVTTEFGLSVMGLGVSRDIQTWIHELVDSDRPSGWDNQISDGGELTAYYRVGLQKRLTPFRQEGVTKHFEASLDMDLWLGYYTNASMGPTLRLGKFYSRYFEFTSAPVSGGSQALRRGRDKGELFAFFSSRGRLVGYNALLQGGFRDSAYTISGSELNRALLEMEAGVHGSWNVSGRTSLYGTWVMFAGRSAEFDTDFSRAHWWGSLQLGLTFAPES